MSISEIIKKLFSGDLKINLKDFLKVEIIIDKSVKINTLEQLTPKQLEEVMEKSLETAGELEALAELGREDSKLPMSLKEAIAKTIVSETILTNLSTLRQKISKDLVKLDPNVAVNLLIKCDKCGKFFNSLIGGNLSSLIVTTFINNIHQCQYCGNEQPAKDNSDYFVEIK